MKQAVQIRIRGIVQGVGFRPFVYRSALQHEIQGWVINGAAGVEIFAQGSARNVDDFRATLSAECPPLARVSGVDVEAAEADDSLQGFEIRASDRGESPLVDIARDTTVCANCLTEMRNPADRRYRHPFINCTDCGPRYTIIQKMPYDRPCTTMSKFTMCPDCHAEYVDPADRRFHAQPVSCPKCGPQLSFVLNDGTSVTDSAPLDRAIQMLQEGKIVAVKGLGGFHLCCRADDEDVVQTLRQRKGRKARPFALMARDIESACRYARISEREQELLESIERPITILRMQADHACAPSVAPGVDTLGVMLPYTPLHELLMCEGGFEVLIVTSGNPSGQPLCKDNDAALRALSHIADGFLMHDRPIEVPLDDSIARIMAGEPVLLRRARGYVPAPLPAPFEVSGIAALGGIMKSTVCVGRRQTAYVSQYLGTLENVETVEHAGRVLDHLKSVLGVEPEQYVIDLHPGGYQKFLLPESSETKVETVQHHHAHAVACMAENGIEEPALCMVFDGMGMGEDGTIWGGEVLRSTYTDYERIGHLEPIALPGGDAATKHPGRIAYAALHQLVDHALLDECFSWMPQGERMALLNMQGQPQTSSMGRLFDALSALLDICREQTYEGQAAIELEAQANSAETAAYDIELEWHEDRCTLPGPALLAAAFEERIEGVPAAQIAARFHNTLAQWVGRIAEETGASRIGLCGGCFQNMFLLEAVRAELEERGIEYFAHRRLSPGDESVSYGQLMVAAARRAARMETEEVPCV